MGSRLFIGNLAFRATEDDIIEHFETIGEVVDAQVCTDRNSGKSRGFGFVEMENEGMAEKAILKLHGSKIKGREIRIDFAKEE